MATNRAARREAKVEARSAASTGSLSRSNVQALRSAGVSSNAISQIRSTNRSAVNPIPGQPTVSFTESPSNEGPRPSNYNPNQQTQAATPNRFQAIRDSENLTDAIKIAASNDRLIGGKEMKNLMKIDGFSVKNFNKGYQRLNSKFAKERGYIGLNAGVYNKLNSGQYDTSSDARNRLYGSLMDSTLGSGMTDNLGWLRQGSDIRANRGDVYYPGTTPESSFLPKSVFNSGQNGWSRFASAYSPGSDVNGAVDTTSPADGGIGDATTIATEPPVVQDPAITQTPDSSQFGSGGDVTGSGSVRFPRKKPKGLGIKSTLTGSSTAMPSSAYGTGLNTGYSRMLQS
jgi:hypothetical protein